jgi:hypothetical protein
MSIKLYIRIPELLEHGNVYSSGSEVMRKGGKRERFASGLSKKRLAVQRFCVELFLEVGG